MKVFKMKKEEAVQYAVECLSAAQKSHMVHDALMNNGYSKEEAYEVLDIANEIKGEAVEKSESKSKIFNKLFGFVLLISGVGMLIYSYTSAQPGGLYVIPAGIIGLGFYLTFR